ncbi:MAG: hypothetical protein H7227_08475 [Actinobacteria bacterium]|nr:hypothetical protein [Actinomycetota bacterium]
MASKSKAITVAITTVALSLGSVGIATAANSKNSSKSKTTISSTAVKSRSSAFSFQGMGGSGEELKGILAALVTNGTLTQAQSGAITAAIEAARTAKQTSGDSNRLALEALIANTIGIDAATIKTRLSAGESLATIAGAKKDALIAALVAEATKRIDEAVTAAKITAAQATTLKVGLVAHVTAEVNAVGGRGPEMGHGMGKSDGDKRRGRGHGPDKMGAPRMGAPMSPAPAPTA